LQKHQSQRLTPGRLLEHPWITKGRRRNVNMELFMQRLQQS
jgi:hypothetical protein